MEEPHPLNERQALEHELREELPAQLAAYRQELENAPVINRTRRERLEWEIRRMQKRMADVEMRLTKVSAESRPQP